MLVVNVPGVQPPAPKIQAFVLEYVHNLLLRTGVLDIAREYDRV